jgi:hypothetical protein
VTDRGRVFITVEWLGGEHETFTLNPEIQGGERTRWGWRVVMRGGSSFLIIRPQEGRRFEIPLCNVKNIEIDTSERINRSRSGGGRDPGPDPGPIAAPGPTGPPSQGGVGASFSWNTSPGVVIPVGDTGSSGGEGSGGPPVPRSSQRTTQFSFGGQVSYHYPDCGVVQPFGGSKVECHCDARDLGKP